MLPYCLPSSSVTSSSSIAWDDTSHRRNVPGGLAPSSGSEIFICLRCHPRAVLLVLGHCSFGGFVWVNPNISLLRFLLTFGCLSLEYVLQSVSLAHSHRSVQGKSFRTGVWESQILTGENSQPGAFQSSRL